MAVKDAPETEQRWVSDPDLPGPGYTAGVADVLLLSFTYPHTRPEEEARRMMPWASIVLPAFLREADRAMCFVFISTIPAPI
jgi:hypothetical protein